jgi:hypothetical protein
VKLFLLPIEPFEERYTGQWLKWWPAGLQELGLEVRLITGSLGAGEREGGEFLDPYATWQWKGSQVAELASAFRSGSIKDGDVILSLDGWGPATEAAAYMRDASGIKVNLVVFFHAGSYDPWDFLARRGMERWAEGIERSWLQASDLVLVGSHFHRDLLIQSRGARPERVFVCGVPVYRDCLAVPMEWSKRPPLVVFPHRLAPEKAPWEFDRIQEFFSAFGQKDVVWVKTRDPRWKGTEFDGFTSKAHYYRLLAKARVVVSTARQETFGIAMQEGIASGAWAVAPSRLSYPELIRSNEGFLYDSDDLFDAAQKVYRALSQSNVPKWSAKPEQAIRLAGEEIIGRFA